MGLLKTLLGTIAGQKIGEKTAGRGFLGAGIGLVATRLAMRSIPGAALVGGGFLAKKLYDKRKARRAEEASLSTGLSDEDTDMAMARAEGETGIAEDALSLNGDSAAMLKNDVAVGDVTDAEQLDPIPPRPVTR